MSTSKFNFSSTLFLTSTIAAMGVHWYLTSEHIDIKYSAGAGSAMCNISETINCSTTIMSSFSEVLGVPLAVFGFITNLFILTFGLKSLYLDQDPRKSTAITLGLSLFSVAASVTMGLISIFIIRSLCPFCAVTYLLSFVTFFSALAWTTGFKFSIFATYAKNLAVQFAIIGVAGLVAGKVVLGSTVSSEMSETMALVVSDWKMRSELDVQLVEPLVLGPDSAKMKILEFSDFLCSHCKNALPKLHTFAKAHKNDVQIIFQSFPLDGCAGPAENPGRRCDLAKIAYCSQKQNKGWEAQEYFFDKQESLYELSKLDEELPKIAQHLSIDITTLNDCIKNPETLKVVKAQMELGKKLGVEGTPAIFINNKIYKGGPHIPTLLEVFKAIQ